MKPTDIVHYVELKGKFYMNENRKVRYTRKVIKESFLNLLRKKPIGKITVAEICELADVHRGTFYQHYHDVYDLLEAIETEFYIKVEEMKPTLDFSLNSITSATITLIYNEQNLCSAILGEYGDTQFLQRVLDICRQRSYNNYSKLGINEADYQHIYTYCTSGCIGIIRLWINTGFQESQETIVEYIERLTQSGLSGFINKNNLQ